MVSLLNQDAGANIPLEKLVAKYPFWVESGAQVDKIRQLLVLGTKCSGSNGEQFPPVWTAIKRDQIPFDDRQWGVLNPNRARASRGILV
jgi:hypothetical protein